MSTKYTFSIFKCLQKQEAYHHDCDEGTCLFHITVKPV